MAETSEVLAARVERMRRAAAKRDGERPVLVQEVWEPPARPDPDPASGDPATFVERRWRLLGYDGGSKDAKVIHDSTCVGDRNLDEAMRALEARPEVRRTKAVLL